MMGGITPFHAAGRVNVNHLHFWCRPCARLSLVMMTTQAARYSRVFPTTSLIASSPQTLPWPARATATAAVAHSVCTESSSLMRKSVYQASSPFLRLSRRTSFSQASRSTKPDLATAASKVLAVAGKPDCRQRERDDALPSGQQPLSIDLYDTAPCSERRYGADSVDRAILQQVLRRWLRLETY